jgi:flagella basal body P-ring formation protein FlgA
METKCLKPCEFESWVEQAMKYSDQTKKRLRSSAFICGYFFCLVAAQTNADSIRLLDRAGSDGPGVVLAQIAELDGDYAQSLRDLEVGEFGEGQTTLTVQLSTVRRLLTEAQVNWASLTLRGRTSCAVTRTSGVSTLAKVDNDRAITTNRQLDVGHANAGLTVGDLLEAELVRLNAVPRHELEITFRGNADDAAWLNRSAAVGRYEIEPLGTGGLGKVAFKTRRYDPAGTIEQATLTADVALLTEAVVALRPIRRGESFTDHNVAVRPVKLTGRHGETLEDTGLLLGQAAASSLREGAIVYAERVAPDVLVKRGEIITVACVSGSLVVRTVGRAAEDGAMGDIISVRHEETRETFFATVCGKRQARIDSPAPGSQPATTESLASTESTR